jgi:hypothetical protein
MGSTQASFGKSIGLPVSRFKCHQVIYHPFKNHGSLHIVVEWGHISRNVGLQHEELICYG